jgi:hypothetical protein
MYFFLKNIWILLYTVLWLYLSRGGVGGYHETPITQMQMFSVTLLLHLFEKIMPSVYQWFEIITMNCKSNVLKWSKSVQLKNGNQTAMPKLVRF